jgi:selenocysteine-specific elongation factor
MPTTTYNVNVGVLGHVDSGKTSLGEPNTCAVLLPLLVLLPPPPHQLRNRRPFLARAAVAALSTTLSTAALDKNPQSRERGITLDLGFSSFTVRWRTWGACGRWPHS